MSSDIDAVTASREPVDLAALRRAQTVRGRWTVTTVAETGSTNTDLATAANGGATDGTVLIAEWQRAGRGRLGRTWTAPAGSGLTMSILLELPEVPLPRRSWIGALTGLSLAAAVGRSTGVATALKWPNDLLVDGAKCAGLLAEATAGGVVVGFGLNVSLRRAELPRPDATSLLLAGAAHLDRAALAAAVLDDLADRRTAGPPPPVTPTAAACARTTGTVRDAGLPGAGRAARRCGVDRDRPGRHRRRRADGRHRHRPAQFHRRRRAASAAG